MKWQLGLEVIVLMSILRLAVPLLVTFGMGYVLHRLNARWQAELASEDVTPLAGAG